MTISKWRNGKRARVLGAVKALWDWDNTREGLGKARSVAPQHSHSILTIPKCSITSFLVLYKSIVSAFFNFVLEQSIIWIGNRKWARVLLCTLIMHAPSVNQKARFLTIILWNATITSVEQSLVRQISAIKNTGRTDTVPVNFTWRTMSIAWYLLKIYEMW